MGDEERLPAAALSRLPGLRAFVITLLMAACPSCHRPVAIARPTCLYCGAALPAEAVLEAAESAAGLAKAPLGTPDAAGPAGSPGSEAFPTGDRLVLVLDFTAAPDAEAVARALGLSAFEAGQRVRRGGTQLHRVDALDRARAEAARLEALGLRVLAVPEAEARRPVVAVRGGARSAAGLELRSPEGVLRIAAPDLSLIVRGPIAREYQPRWERRKVNTATLEGGYRIHFHRRDDPRAVEVDPFAFEFSGGPPLAGSSRLELEDWIVDLFPEVPEDDGFRRETVALAPAAPATGTLAAAGALRGREAPGARRGDTALVLDNLEQFRFYSGWKAAVERRRQEPAPPR